MNQLDPQLRLSYEQLKYIKHAHCPKGYVMIERYFDHLGGAIEHCIQPTEIENWVRSGWKLSDANNGEQPITYTVGEIKQIIQAHKAVTNLEKHYHLQIYTPSSKDEAYWIGAYRRDKTDRPIGDMVACVRRPSLVEAVLAIDEVIAEVAKS